MSKPTPRKLSYYFTASRRKGREGLPLISVTMHNGLVRREELDRKMDSALTPEEHLLVEPNDIAYNTMRMWQGCFGLAEEAANVSPAYVVMRPKDTVDPRFAAHWFKSDRGLYMLWAYSYGLTEDRLRLYGDEFLQIPVAWPHASDQSRIADILDAWDDAADSADVLADEKDKRHRGLVRGLSAIADCQRHELESFASLVRKKVGLNPSVTVSLELENIESKTGRKLGVTPASALIGNRSAFQPGDVLFGKLRPYLQKYFYADYAGVASTEFWVIRANDQKCRSRFLYYLVQQDAFSAEAQRPTGSKMPRAEWDLVGAAPLPLPNLQAQDQLVAALDASEASATAQRGEASLLRRQKRGLMQKLLTGEWQIPENIDRLSPGGDAAAALAREASAA
jgi:type I restriction enzyme S subunit